MSRMDNEADAIDTSIEWERDQEESPVQDDLPPRTDSVIGTTAHSIASVSPDVLRFELPDIDNDVSALPRISDAQGSESSAHWQSIVTSSQLPAAALHDIPPPILSPPILPPPTIPPPRTNEKAPLLPQRYQPVHFSLQSSQTTVSRQTSSESPAPSYSSDPVAYNSQISRPLAQDSRPDIYQRSPISMSVSQATPTSFRPLPDNTVRRKTSVNAYVAHNPFRLSISSDQTLAAESFTASDMTFDDLPTVCTSSSIPLQPGNSYEVSEHLSSFPTSRYKTPLLQHIGRYQYQYQYHNPKLDPPSGIQEEGQQATEQRPLPPLPHDNHVVSMLPDQTDGIPKHSSCSIGYPASPSFLGEEASPNVSRSQSLLPHYYPDVAQHCDSPFPVASADVEVQRKKEGYGKIANRLMFVVLPRMFYLYLLLHLPSLYFRRVARIFEEADLSLQEIKKMAIETAVQAKCDLHTMEKKGLPPQYEQLKTTWETFIDDVMTEWQTFNIVSVLLLSAILSILSHDASVTDPVLKYCALSSLICALVSLLFGCTYIIQFGGMRKTYKAAEWALEAQKTKTSIFWNVWVFLAMPVVWLTWSMLLFLVCVMLFVWRAGNPLTDPMRTPSNTGLLCVRVMLTCLFVLGLNYGILILATFSHYGEKMEKTWKRRIDGWLEERAAASTSSTNYISASYSAWNRPHSQEEYALRRSNSLPSVVCVRSPGSNFDQTSYQSPPSYLSGTVENGYGYTSNLEKLNTYHTKRNTMLNQFAHLKRDDPASNCNYEDYPVVNLGSTTPAPDTAALTGTVRQAALKPSVHSLPPIRIPPLNSGSHNYMEDSSPRERDEEENNSPRVRFRSPLASAPEPFVTQL